MRRAHDHGWTVVARGDLSGAAVCHAEAFFESMPWADWLRWLGFKRRSSVRTGPTSPTRTSVAGSLAGSRSKGSTRPVAGLSERALFVADHAARPDRDRHGRPEGPRGTALEDGALVQIACARACRCVAIATRIDSGKRRGSRPAHWPVRALMSPQ
jgi:hypothetical protein